MSFFLSRNQISVRALVRVTTQQLTRKTANLRAIPRTSVKIGQHQRPVCLGVQFFSTRIQESQPPSLKEPSDDRSIFKDQDDTIVDKYFPDAIKPYAKLARLDRPVGTWLLMFPGWWSIALAANPGELPRLDLLAAFGVGAFIMRSAGCTINDLWDRDIDGKVARTKNRPLASGALSVSQALNFLGAQLFAGLFVLTTLNEHSIVLGASSLALVATYPVAKRYLSWPQLVLGLTFNWGALLGWSAVHGSLDYAVVLPLYAGCVSWTLMYDTLYAHQDKEDDRKLGLKSSALTIGDDNTPAVLAAFSAATLVGLGLAGSAADVGYPYFVGLGLAGAHLGWQVHTADLTDRVNLTKRFVSNQWIGALVFSGAVLGKLQMPLVI